MKRFDAVMIGFGKGAKTLAAELAARGEKVAVIEQSDKMYGGTCTKSGAFHKIARQQRRRSETAFFFCGKAYALCPRGRGKKSPDCHAPR